VNRSSPANGLITVSIIQLLTVAFAITAATAAFSEPGLAQDSDDAAAIVIEPLWNNGYMGLGGGLQNVILKPEAPQATPDVSARRPRHVAAARPAVAQASVKIPARLISDTLDPNGWNVVRFGTQ
jgi:hypothetical protein